MIAWLVRTRVALLDLVRAGQPALEMIGRWRGDTYSVRVALYPRKDLEGRACVAWNSDDDRLALGTMTITIEDDAPVLSFIGNPLVRTSIQIVVSNPDRRARIIGRLARFLLLLIPGDLS